MSDNVFPPAGFKPDGENTDIVEIERLREIETLYKAGTAAWNPVYKIVLDDRDRLRAEVERLRAALEQCAADWISPPGTVSEGAAYLYWEFRRRAEVAAAALGEIK